MRCSERQHGFTLIEVLIAIGLVALITAMSYPIFDSMLDFGQRETTHTRLLEAANAIKNAYRDNALMVDSSLSGQYFCGVPGACITPAPSNAAPPSATPASQADGAQTAQALQLIAQSQGLNVERLEVDGYNKYFRYFVSNALSKANGPGGATVYYHVIAIVSSDGKNQLSPGTTFNPSTGQLTLATGDQGVVVSGLPIEQAYYQEAMTQLRALADDYGQFFTSRYLSSNARNPSTDYFSQPDAVDSLNAQSFDSSSPICNSGNNNCGWNFNGDPFPGQLGTPVTNTAVVFWDCQPATVLGGFMSSLGLSQSAVTDPWGYPVGVCNGPNATGAGVYVRNPSNNNAALQTQPYTAAIVAWAPGGVPLTATVVGQD